MFSKRPRILFILFSISFRKQSISRCSRSSNRLNVFSKIWHLLCYAAKQATTALYSAYAEDIQLLDHQKTTAVPAVRVWFVLTALLHFWNCFFDSNLFVFRAFSIILFDFGVSSEFSFLTLRAVDCSTSLLELFLWFQSIRFQGIFHYTIRFRRFVQLQPQLMGTIFIAYIQQFRMFPSEKYELFQLQRGGTLIFSQIWL